MVKHYSVEYGVDDVPDSSRKDQRNTGDKAKGVVLLHQLIQVITYKTDGHDAEDRQEQLSDYFYPECHSRILGKVQIKPWSNFNALMQLHVSFDPYFKSLVKNKEQHHNQRCSPTFGISHFIWHLPV